MPGTRETAMDERVLVPGVDQLAHSVRRLGEQVRDAGTSVAGELVPVGRSAADLLHSLRTVLSAAPAPTAAVDVLVEEVAAKRALVRALREQLDAFDKELEVLERALVPLQEWGRQWERLQSLVTAPLRG